MKNLSVDHLLGIKFLNLDDLELIFETADNFKEVINRPIKKVPSLRDITIANLFFENSTRTKLSFELAEKRLSADVLNFSSSQSSVKKGESLIDTVNNILSMKVDMVVIRHPNPGAPQLLSKKVNATIINAGDGAHEHPTQALLDSYSMRQQIGDLRNKNILIVGDIIHSRVALSNIFALQLQGANVKVCGPNTLIPKYLKDFGVKVETDFDKALEWCDVANMLRLQNERMNSSFLSSNREYYEYYGLTPDKLENAKEDALIMHPGPMNRGIEIDTNLADDINKSVIKEQVELGVAVRMACLKIFCEK